MGRNVKLIAFSIVGLLGSAASKPLLAEAAAVDMPWPAQFGLCSLFGWMLWWAMAKTIPQISKDAKDAAIEASKSHSASLDNLSEKMEGVRAEIRAGNDSQLALLRNVLQQGRQGQP